MRHPGALRILAPAAIALCAAAAPARAQFRAGPEFRLNSYTTSDQFLPAVSVERGSEFVVVWHSYGQDGDSYGVWARSFRDDGTPRSPVFRTNTTVVGAQERPVVAYDGNEFVVVWSSYAQDGDGFGVFGRIFDKDGTPETAEFRVNTYTTGNQTVTSVAKDRRTGSVGGFVVAWTDYESDYGGVKARRYDETGAPRGGEFRVNVFTPYLQTGARVAAADDGRFVVAWNSYLQDGDQHGVFVRRFDAAGNPVGGELQVNTTGAGDQYLGGLAITPDGRFVVAWQQDDGSDTGVFARRFDASGQPQGTELRVNTYTTGPQHFPSVAINERGDFTVAWEDTERHDGDLSGIFGQRFDKLGNLVGQEFQVNTYTTGEQFLPEVGVDAVGNFVVTWASLGQDGDGWGVFAQRFGGILFPAQSVDATPSLGPYRGPLASDGNGVLEPGETVTVETFWENVSGVAQGPIGGRVLVFTGPPGPTYTVPDPNASFGTIPNGATVGCATTQDCYVVGVSGARPATHWDGLMEEGVNSIILGQAKLWDMHVGDSFADVPRSSPFYRFVETLLHHGVTGGCTPTTYCPQASTSREQMAVFVLVAAEGAQYQPVPCPATTMFTDVPPSSPFCRWIEELARRGVVAGCGPGTYCPTAPVSREQMAVFVLRTLDGDLNPPACGTPMFNDVPASSPFCRWIEELARRGVVSGCGGGAYCPTAAVTREQMGVFLAVTFGLTLYGGL
jgi:hypothetical protein